MTLVAGVDSSTQSVKVVVRDADTGALVREGRAPHPDGTEVAPQAWWDALLTATDGLLDDVAAVSVAGQQHGMVVLDDEGAVVRPALLWNDTRSAHEARDLTTGGRFGRADHRPWGRVGHGVLVATVGGVPPGPARARVRPGARGTSRG